MPPTRPSGPGRTWPCDRVGGQLVGGPLGPGREGKEVPRTPGRDRQRLAQFQPMPTCTPWPIWSNASFTSVIFSANLAQSAKLVSLSMPNCHQRTWLARRNISGSSDGYQVLASEASSSAAGCGGLQSIPTSSTPSASSMSRKAANRARASSLLGRPHQTGYFTRRTPAWPSNSINHASPCGWQPCGRVQPNSLLRERGCGLTTARFNCSPMTVVSAPEGLASPARSALTR